MEQKKLIIGNWKSNPKTLKLAEKNSIEIDRLAKKNRTVRIAIAVPQPFIGLSKKTKNIHVGVQDVSSEGEGAFTGRATAEQLTSAGATFTIVGHSEMREYGDTNERVAQKIQQAAKAKLPFVLCVGEKKRDHDGDYLHTIHTQLTSALEKIGAAKKFLFAVAYEPVWAIGAHATAVATPKECLEVVIHIRRTLQDLFGNKIAQATPILYGGSVNAANASGFLTEGGAQGLLVGRDSLEVKTFSKIISIA